jgi:hypothetical protein
MIVTLPEKFVCEESFLPLGKRKKRKEGTGTLMVR